MAWRVVIILITALGIATCKSPTEKKDDVEDSLAPGDKVCVASYSDRLGKCEITRWARSCTKFVVTNESTCTCNCIE